ncbi:hypothetical protein [Desulfolithobacter sp.]
MKKATIVCAALCLMAMPTLVFAAAEELTTSSTTVTNTNGVNGGPDLTFTPSPNVSLQAYTTTTAYALTATNILTDANNGMVFGTLNSSSGYAQRQKTDTDVTAEKAPAPTSATALPTDADADWTWMGGS